MSECRLLLMLGKRSRQTRCCVAGMIVHEVMYKLDGCVRSDHSLVTDCDARHEVEAHKWTPLPR